jgi:hypothetical protein
MFFQVKNSDPSNVIGINSNKTFFKKQKDRLLLSFQLKMRYSVAEVSANKCQSFTKNSRCLSVFANSRLDNLWL